MPRKYVVVYLKPAYDTVTAETPGDAGRIVKATLPYLSRMIAVYPLDGPPPVELSGMDLPGNVEPVA